MTIKQHGGIFGRNPTFNDVDASNVTTSDLTASSVTTGDLTSENLTIDSTVPLLNITDRIGETPYTSSLLQSGAHLYIDNKNAGGALRFRTDTNQERLNIGANDGDVTVKTGNLIIGTSGKGIDFSATSGTGTSELFDDYEEGTWTPTLTRLTAGDFSYSASGADEGTYTKIGRMVYAKFRINGTFTESTASGAYVITGLPYTTPTNNHLFSVFYTSGGTVLDAVPRALDTRIQLLFTPTSGFNYVGGGFYTAS